LDRMVKYLIQNDSSNSYTELHNYTLDNYEFAVNVDQLNDLFCTSANNVFDVFKTCVDFFEVFSEGIADPSMWRIRYVFRNNRSTDDQKDICISSRSILNADMARNAKLADRVFEIVPAKKKISVEDVLRELYAVPPIKELAENPPVSQRMFLGYLQMYWGSVFKIQPDYETNQVFIKRQALHHQKPSQEKKVMKDIMSSLPTYPSYVELDENRMNRWICVTIWRRRIPSDGIFVDFVELQESREFICQELAKEWSVIKGLPKDEKKKRVLHPNDTFIGLPCLVKSDDDLYRCKITGQSNGLAMVLLADYPQHSLVEIKELYKLPPPLLGIPQTGVYIVLNGPTMDSKSEKKLWEQVLDEIENSKIKPKIKVRFVDKALNSDYSGRRKDMVYRAELKIEFQNETKLIPQGWA